MNKSTLPEVRDEVFLDAEAGSGEDGVERVWASLHEFAPVNWAIRETAKGARHSRTSARTERRPQASPARLRAGAG